MLKKGQQFECRVEDLSFGGKGLIRIDGLVIFIKSAIPGQKIKAVLTKKKKDYAEAKIIEILEKSPKEITPKCKHFGVCGGCSWQNLEYKDQLEYKSKQILECLSHIGKILDNTDPSSKKRGLTFNGAKINTSSSPEIFEYRNKLEFSFGYQSMRVENDKNGNRKFLDEGPTLGFHKPGKWEEVVDIEYCHLVPENLNKVFNTIKDWTLSQEKDVYNPKTHRGFWRQLLIRKNIHGQLLANIIVNGKVESHFFDELVQNLKKNNFIHSFFYTVHEGLNDDWTKGEVLKLCGEDLIYEEVLDMKFAISPESFFQTNTRGAEVLYKKVLGFVEKSYKEDSKKNTNSSLAILDLYCGTGTIGQIIAGHISSSQLSNNTNLEIQIIGLELLESAVKDAYKNAKLNGLKNIEYISGAAEKTFPQVLEKYKKFDIVIVDPPRAGMHPKALQTLLQTKAKNIIYVSCNPSTFARDMGILKRNNYALKEISGMDMFPHTPHIEIVALIEYSLVN